MCNPCREKVRGGGERERDRERMGAHDLFVELQVLRYGWSTQNEKEDGER